MISLISSFFPAGKKARPTTGRLTQSLRKERVPTNNKTRPNSLPTFADQRVVTDQTRRSPRKVGRRPTYHSTPDKPEMASELGPPQPNLGPPNLSLGGQILHPFPAFLFRQKVVVIVVTITTCLPSTASHTLLAKKAGIAIRPNYDADGVFMVRSARASPPSQLRTSRSWPPLDCIKW